MTELYDLRAGAATIVVDDEPFAGVEVVVDLAASYRTRREVRRLRMAYAEAEPFGDEEAAALDALYELVAAEVFLEWNVAIAGERLPLTAAGLHRAAPELVMHVLALWWQYVGMVMPPLPSSSPSTASDAGSTSSDSSDGEPSADAPTTTAVRSTR